MPLTSGTRLGPYEVIAPLGQGGMGEVYRARDTKLGRDVALKILPESFAGDADRLMRFEREARTLASLNHPNIAAIYGIEGDGPPAGVGEARPRALVMELVEGEDLAERIARGAMPLDEALPIARQIAEALEAAHDRGIIHRDLKPANVKVKSDGTVKVLDFGLAKTRESSGDAATDLAHAPTATATLTALGAILGTTAYMAPEQACGRPVDARADIWAFGVVLWEMLTGRRPFDGETVSDVLAAVLRDEPDWDALPRRLSPALVRLLRRCLRRDPARRLRHVGDARLELEEAAEQPTVGVESPADHGGSHGIGAEHSWPLTTAVCRHLNRDTLDAALIGDELQYRDNGRPSDVLVVYVPGFGFGHGVFEEVLDRSMHRGVAVTLYGFEQTRRRRIPLPLADHLTLLRLFVESVVEASRPKTTVLCGFSSSADIVLRMISETGLHHGTVDGVLALSPNLSLDTCFFSRRVADIPPDRDEQILDISREVAAAMSTPQAWLHMMPYLMELVRKYHADIHALRLHGRDIIAPFIDGGDSPFAGWYRAAKRTGIPVRVVFAGAEDDEQRALRALMLAHVDRQVFGPDFDDRDITSEPDALHMDLMRAGVVEEHLEALLARLRHTKT